MLLKLPPHLTCLIARLRCCDKSYIAGLLDKQLLAWKDLTAWCQAID
jgi:hypothetical protein